MTKLNRYTTLPVLLDLLERQSLTLLDPATWEDRNDSELLMEYKRRKAIPGLFALCFSYGDETIHHWKTYANGPSGCLIEFDASSLLKCLVTVPGLRHGSVQYLKLSEVMNAGYAISIDDIPFTKRWPYRNEEEYRIVVENDDAIAKHVDIPISLDTIRRITINQHMPASIYDTIRNFLRSAVSNPEARINRSTLYENTKWISRFRTSAVR